MFKNGENFFRDNKKVPRKQPAEKCYKSQKKEGCIEGGSGYYTINWLVLIKNKDHMHLLNIYCKQLFDCFEIMPICLMMSYKKFFEIVLDFELKGSINVILLKITSELANTSQKKTWKFLVIQYWASNHHSYIRGRRSLVKKLDTLLGINNVLILWNQVRMWKDACCFQLLVVC